MAFFSLPCILFINEIEAKKNTFFYPEQMNHEIRFVNKQQVDASPSKVRFPFVIKLFYDKKSYFRMKSVGQPSIFSNQLTSILVPYEMLLIKFSTNDFCQMKICKYDALFFNNFDR